MRIKTAWIELCSLGIVWLFCNDENDKEEQAKEGQNHDWLQYEWEKNNKQNNK